MHILGRKNSQVYAFFSALKGAGSRYAYTWEKKISGVCTFQCPKRSREHICIYLVRKMVRYMHYLENGYKSERKYA